MSDLFGFDEEYYLNAKLNALKGDPEHADITTTEELKVVISENGMTPQEHYKRYGNSENISTSAYFNKAEYLTAKLVALRESSETSAEWANKSIDELEVVMAQAGMTPAEHYSRYGYAETRADGTLLNPSNAFDANAYFAAKLEELQKTDPEHYGSATVLDVLGIFQQQQLDPVSHYLNYGASEAIISKTPMVQTVPTSQRMPEDPARAEMGTLVPDNPSKPSLPPSLALPFEVPQPGDMGGHNYETVLPPATEPVPTPEIPGITPPADPKPEEPKPEEPKPEEPGTGGGSGSGGGTDPDPTPNPDPTPEPLPEGALITLDKAGAIVTPLSSTNAGGRYTADNRTDLIEITKADAFNAVLDAGTCNDGRREQENDTLTISVDTNGKPLVNDGIVDLSMTNFETLVLGDGVQKVRPGDYFKHDNNNLKHVVFDDKDDMLDLSGLSPYLTSITTKGAGQGNIVFHDWETSYGTNYYQTFDLSNVQWGKESTINSIVFKNTFDKQLIINNADLAKVDSIVAEGNGGNYSSLDLRGEIKADKAGKGQILDTGVQDFKELNLQSAKLADDVASLEVDAQYNNVVMNASRWKQLTQLSTTDAGNTLTLNHDWETPEANQSAVDKILAASTVLNFETLYLSSMQNLETLDASKSAFTTIKIDGTTAQSLAGKTLVGDANQTLQAVAVNDDVGLSAFGSLQGFASLDLRDYGWNEERTLTLDQDSKLDTINLNNWSTPSATGGSLHIKDMSGRTNTVHAQTGIALKTTGIENIIVQHSALLDASCFADSTLQTVSGDSNYNGDLSLVGTVSKAVLDKITANDNFVTGIKTLNLSLADLAAEVKTIDASKFDTVEIANTQATDLTVNNVSSLYIRGGDTKTADLNGLTLTGTGSGTPTITIHGDYSDDNINMTGYAANLTINGGRGTLLGGEGDDTLWSYGYGTQKGGAGNDTLYMDAYPWENDAVLQEGGAGNDALSITLNTSHAINSNFSTLVMTGGAGIDSFTAVWDMDQLETADENASTYPDIRLEITDFGKGGTETLDISSIRYDGLPDSDGLATTQYFQSSDYVTAVVNATTASDLNQALNMAAKAITANKIGVFEFGSDTYLFGNNIHVAVDRGDLLIKLTGVDADQLTTADFVFQV